MSLVAFSLLFLNFFSYFLTPYRPDLTFLERLRIQRRKLGRCFHGAESWGQGEGDATGKIRGFGRLLDFLFEALHGLCDLLLSWHLQAQRRENENWMAKFDRLIKLLLALDRLACLAVQGAVHGEA